jgi:paraquat-inducible protein A
VSTAAPADASPVLTGRQLGLYSCATCGCVSQVTPPHSTGTQLQCPRCATPLSRPRRASLQSTWAYLLAATVLYIPANVFPIMSTSSVFDKGQYTLLGGIVELWASGDWTLSTVVFVASIAVPIVKIGALSLLAATAQHRSCWRSAERTQLFRMISVIGHWSMLDVFVVVLLVGMLSLGPFAGVEPQAGLLAFGAVVVLTMLASDSFDARLLWPEPSTRKTP